MLKELLAGLVVTSALVAPIYAGEEEEKAATLTIGDKAPRLEHVNWLQGTAVTDWAEGEVYVLDMWATWCGPCVRAIPHMNKIHNEMKDKKVHVVGVAIWPNDRMTPTAEFVTEKGADMAYRIAEDIDGKTAQAYMEPSGSNGIPTVFIVNQEGKIAWIGHPMQMDEPLKEVVAGTWDLTKAREKALKAAEVEKKAQPIQMAIGQAFQAGDFKEASAKLEELIDLDPEQFGSYLPTLYTWKVAKVKDAAGAKSVAERIMKMKDEDGQLLNAFAWGIVGEDSEIPEEMRDLDTGLKAAELANERSGGKNAMILDTLARAHFVKGNTAEAVKFQRMAIENLSAEEKAQMGADMEAALKEYEKGRA